MALLLLGFLTLYLVAPLIAGLSRYGDRRGPKIFWIEHHEVLFILAHEFVYGEKPRPFPNERGWFYGLKGKPYIWPQLYRPICRFEEQVDQTAMITLRQVWRDVNGRFPLAIGRSEWPESFAANGVLEVRAEEHGIYVVLKREREYEAGIVILGEVSAKDTIERDPVYSYGILWKDGVYHYYRESKSKK